METLRDVMRQESAKAWELRKGGVMQPIYNMIFDEANQGKNEVAIPYKGISTYESHIINTLTLEGFAISICNDEERKAYEANDVKRDLVVSWNITEDWIVNSKASYAGYLTYCVLNKKTIEIYDKIIKRIKGFAENAYTKIRIAWDSLNELDSKEKGELIKKLRANGFVVQPSSNDSEYQLLNGTYEDFIVKW